MFVSVDSALKWSAMMVTIDSTQLPSINRMYGRPPPSTNNDILIGLTQEQARMQAEEILGLVVDLNDPACTEYINSKYRYDNLGETLMSRVMSGLMYSGGVNQRDIRSLVAQYIGWRSYSHRELRKDLHCKNNEVSKYRNAVYNSLDAIHRKSMDYLDDRMKRCGLVESTTESICA